MSRLEDLIKGAQAQTRANGPTRSESILGGALDSRPVAKGRVASQKNDQGMNKTEVKYASHLDELKWTRRIVAWWWDTITIKIGQDCRYITDFLVQLPDGELQLHETKGHMEDDALVKLKTVRANLPFRLFVVKQGTKTDPWVATEIRPW